MRLYKTRRVVTDTWVMVHGRVCSAHDLLNTLEEAGDGDVVFHDCAETDWLLRNKILASAGSLRGGYSASLTPKGRRLRDSLSAVLHRDDIPVLTRSEADEVRSNFRSTWDGPYRRAQEARRRRHERMRAKVRKDNLARAKREERDAARFS